MPNFSRSIVFYYSLYIFSLRARKMAESTHLKMVINIGYQMFTNVFELFMVQMTDMYIGRITRTHHRCDNIQVMGRKPKMRRKE